MVLLDGAVKSLGIRSDETGLRLNWIAEAAGAAGKAGPLAFEGGWRALTPLSPVHLRCIRNGSGSGSGSTVVSWTRRGRDNADSWIGTDIPLDEPFEVDRSEWTYLQADETADFGGRQVSLSVRIRQVGERIPLGIPAKATLSV
jgi:hypothetical protein